MRRFTTSDGLSLAYEDEGAGVPLLCLAGLTRDARDFDDLAAVLPHGVRMIRLSTRGRGASDHARDPVAEYVIPVEARDAVELLDHLGLDKVVVLGTSRGGLIAMVLAATVKDRLLGVILNDIGPEIDPSGVARIMDYVGVVPTARSHADMAAVLKLGMGHGFPGLEDAKWRALAERWFDSGPDGLALRYDARLRDALIAGEGAVPPDLWPLFDALAGLPVGVIRGVHSDLLTPKTLAEMQARRPDLMAREVPNRGHVPFLDEPESLEVINSILAKVQA